MFDVSDSVMSYKLTKFVNTCMWHCCDYTGM